MTGFQSIRSFCGAAVLAVVLACSACGGGSSSGGTAGKGATGSAGSTGAAGNAGTAGAAASGTPVALCNQLVATICMRLKSCNALKNPATFVEADCERAENIDYGCDRATSPDFASCVTDTQNESCASLFTANGLTLPGACDGPVNTIPLSTAQQKCADLAQADCTRFFQCSNATPSSTDLLSCEQDDYNGSGCGYATDVGTTYQQCLMDLGTVPCLPDGGGPDPDAGVPSCMNALTFVQ
jgi:hypothetical protein